MPTGADKSLPADLPRIHADFNGLITAYPHRVLLETSATHRSLEALGLELTDGLRAILYDPDENEHGERDDIVCVATVRKDEQLGWVAYLDDDRVMSQSDWAQRD